jgi:hypothetical protein
MFEQNQRKGSGHNTNNKILQLQSTNLLSFDELQELFSEFQEYFSKPCNKSRG